VYIVGSRDTDELFTKTGAGNYWLHGPHSLIKGGKIRLGVGYSDSFLMY
jgi:hypothetical protein